MDQCLAQKRTEAVLFSWRSAKLNSMGVPIAKPTSMLVNSHSRQWLSDDEKETVISPWKSVLSRTDIETELLQLLRVLGTYI